MSEQLQILAFDKRKEADGTSTIRRRRLAVLHTGGSNFPGSSVKSKIFVCKAIWTFFFSLTMRKKYPDVWQNQNLAN